MSSDQVRVHRGSFEEHTSNTRGNVDAVSSHGQDADRQSSFVQRGMNGGAGSDELQGQRGATSRHMEEVTNNSHALARQTGDNANDFLGNVQKAANSINTIK